MNAVFQRFQEPPGRRQASRVQLAAYLYQKNDILPSETCFVEIIVWAARHGAWAGKMRYFPHFPKILFLCPVILLANCSL
jgi:hypothetical protein